MLLLKECKFKVEGVSLIRKSLYLAKCTSVNSREGVKTIEFLPFEFTLNPFSLDN